MNDPPRRNRSEWDALFPIMPGVLLPHAQTDYSPIETSERFAVKHSGRRDILGEFK